MQTLISLEFKLKIDEWIGQWKYYLREQKDSISLEISYNAFFGRYSF